MPSLDTSQNGGKMWVKICNLNHVPKIGETESRSCGKEGPFLKLFLWCLFVWALILWVTVGSLFSSKDFSPAKGRERSMPYSFCSLSLSHKFLSTLYPSSEIPSAVFLFSYFQCPSTFSCVWSSLAWASYLWEFVILFYEWNMGLMKPNESKIQAEETALCRNADLDFHFHLSFSALIDLYKCNCKKHTKPEMIYSSSGICKHDRL